MLDPVQLRKDRQEIVLQLRTLVDGCQERGQETAEEREKMDRMEEDIQKLEAVINREERLQALEKESAKKIDAARGNDGAPKWDGIQYPRTGYRQPSRAEIERRACFALQGWLLSGLPAARRSIPITSEHEESAKMFGINFNENEIELPIAKTYRHLQREFILRESRAGLDVGTATAGQETIPEGFVYNLEMALLAYGGVRSVADVIRTDSGADLPWPTVNDTSNKGAILNEATTFGTSIDPAFSSVTFKAFKYSSKPVFCSQEIITDSFLDLGARIGEMLGIRIGRIQNDHFTTGAGTTLPKGFMVGGTQGVLAASTSAFTGDEVMDLYHSLDPAYRPNASWQMHDTTLAKIRKLKVASTTGGNDYQYLWQPGLQAGVPDMLLGKRYMVNQSMSSTYSASEKVLAFGDFSKYKIRDVATIRLKRLDELFAQTDQVAFIAFLRSDGQLVDAGTNPVMYLTLAAS